MTIWRVAGYLIVSVMALSGCVREEQALTENGSDPIGGGPGPSSPPPPPATPPPPPAPTALALTAPADVQAEATGAATTVDIGQATATGGDGSPIRKFEMNVSADRFPAESYPA